MKLVRRHKIPFTTVGCAFQYYKMYRWQRSSIALLANGSKRNLVRLVKAYQQKKGTTTDKCAASAESDVFIQAVALLDAVIPPIAPRCH